MRLTISKANHSHFLIFLAALGMSSASAHITLENRQATIGSSYKAVFAVPHGCAEFRKA